MYHSRALSLSSLPVILFLFSVHTQNSIESTVVLCTAVHAISTVEKEASSALELHVDQSTLELFYCTYALELYTVVHTKLRLDIYIELYMCMHMHSVHNTCTCTL